MSWFVTPAQLRRRGVVGMNARNGEFIAEHNPRRRFPLVDDKLLTKRLAQAAGVAVPELYGEIRTHHDIRQLQQILEGHGDFVIKPVHGSGGNGIIVIEGRQNHRFRRSSGRLMRLEDIEHHISNILSGAYSLGGQPDVAMIEQRIRFSDVFESISHQGVPDIRLIVYRGCPAMAMVRLPTRQSDGKANLHQGAIGAGVDLVTGVTTDGVWFQERIKQHPDTGAAVAGHAIPHWSQQLELAARCQELTGLDYLGVDIILDRDRGPLLLELNARPGLAIQIANLAGLYPRTRAIEQWLATQPEPPPASRRARWFEEHAVKNL